MIKSVMEKERTQGWDDGVDSGKTLLGGIQLRIIYYFFLCVLNGTC